MFLDILECEDCAGYMLPDRFNLDLVKFGYTGSTKVESQ